MKRTKKVLFLCTGNSCRSIIAEVLLNELGNNKFKAFSAGSFPTGEVNPDSINLLKSHNLPINKLLSKSWDDLSYINFDIVITVCDNATSETCPIYLNNAIKAHWGIPDPDKVREERRVPAFERTYSQLLDRIVKLLQLPNITTESLKRIGNEYI